MKKFLFICALVYGLHYGFYDQALAFIGIGKGRFGISAKDPLGSVEKLHEVLVAGGFEGNLGTINKRRTISYKLSGGSDNYTAAGGITIEVGDEEYVQSIKGVFVGTQHGMSPQRAGPVEIMSSDMWKAAGGPSKLKFNSINDGAIKIPRTIKFPAIQIPNKHMEAEFAADDVKGKWMYGDGTPMELVELSLK